MTVKKKKDFDEAANLPFDDDEIAERTMSETEREKND
jgi:cytochrome c oxidase cbb3-type subunit 4